MTAPDISAPPPRRFPPWLIVVLALAGVVSLGVCALIAVGVLTLLGQQTSTTVITASDGQSQITIPGGWQQMTDLHDSAELQAGSRLQNQYLIVLTEDKADLYMDLATYAETVRDGLTEAMADVRVSNPTMLTIGGHPALQYEVHGTMDDIHVVYWLTGIEGTTNYYQVLGWTAESKAEQNGPTIQHVLESFQALEQ